MDLDLSPARTGTPVSVEAVRPLVPADIVLLSEPRGTRAPTIKRLRDSHHALCKCLSSGMSPTEASIVTGYSLSRISILQQDPAFMELLESYRAAEAATHELYQADLAQRMANIALDVSQVMLDRLEEDPDKFSNQELRELMKVTADRTGHAPIARSINTNVNIDLAERLSKARSRAGLLPPVSREPVV